MGKHYRLFVLLTFTIVPSHIFADELTAARSAPHNGFTSIDANFNAFYSTSSSSDFTRLGEQVRPSFRYNFAFIYPTVGVDQVNLSFARRRLKIEHAEVSLTAATLGLGIGLDNRWERNRCAIFGEGEHTVWHGAVVISDLTATSSYFQRLGDKVRDEVVLGYRWRALRTGMLCSRRFSRVEPFASLFYTWSEARFSITMDDDLEQLATAFGVSVRDAEYISRRSLAGALGSAVNLGRFSLLLHLGGLPYDKDLDGAVVFGALGVSLHF